jgi:Iron dependent repressor, metal binding and dimerisation domain
VTDCWSVSDGRTIELTGQGRLAAVRVMRKHRIAECLLADIIGLDRGCWWTRNRYSLLCAGHFRTHLRHPFCPVATNAVRVPTGLASRGLLSQAAAGWLSGYAGELAQARTAYEQMVANNASTVQEQ